MDKIVVFTPETFIDGEHRALMTLANLGCRVHLRKPNVSIDDFRIYCDKVIPFCPSDSISMHYYHGLAKEYGVDSHHSFSEVDNINSKIVSLSTHTFAEALQAEQLGVGYYFLSPIFNSISKVGYKASFEWSEINNFLCSEHHHTSSCVALGGVEVTNLEKLVNFDSIALLGSVWSGIDSVTDENLNVIINRFNSINTKWQKLKGCNI